VLEHPRELRLPVESLGIDRRIIHDAIPAADMG